VTVAQWTLAGRYRVGERLGSGGTADVFRAHDELLDRDVAVKVFRTAPADDDALYSAARREAELQSLARLNHPNLIRLLDGSIGTDEHAYLVLDLVCGPDLATRLHDGPLPEPEVRAIGRQIADALDYAHSQGMVHRDVKPANILLGTDGSDGGVWARLSDFGTVRMIDGARLTAADLTLGTASYIAPEQAHGADVGPAADIYSLGLILIEALTGQRCFGGTTPEALMARLARAPEIPDWLPADLQALLAAMTASAPEARPTAAAVAESLQAAVPPAVAAAADSETTTSLRAIAPVAGVAGAAVVAGVGSADAAAGAPVAVGSGELPPPVVEPPEAVRPPHGRRSSALFALAALAFAALLTGAAFLLLGGASSSDGDTPSGVQPRERTGVTTGKHAPSSAAGHQVAVAPTGHSASSVSHRPTPSHQVKVGPAPQPTSAARTSVVASTSAPPTPSSSSSAPPPSTSAAPTTSAAPSSTSVLDSAVPASP
jgi:tRNA A-37 threonylcarbamoyl transferase component Bud32